MNKELAIRLCQQLIENLKGRIELLKLTNSTDIVIELKDIKRLLRKYKRTLRKLLDDRNSGNNGH